MDRNEIIDFVRRIVDQEMFGRRMDSYDIDRIDFLAAAVTSARYAQRRMARVARLPDNWALLELGLREAPRDGLILEFGVASARTTNFLAELTEATVYGFDTFNGLPEDWRPGFGRGSFAMDALPEVRSNVELVVGLFDRTLPAFCDAHPGPVAFVHIDCDLYSSTQTVFGCLRSRIQSGTVIVFDEYFNYPGWERHEFKAFREFIASAGLAYRYIGIVPSHQQVAVRIL